MYIQFLSKIMSSNSTVNLDMYNYISKIHNYMALA